MIKITLHTISRRTLAVWLVLVVAVTALIGLTLWSPVASLTGCEEDWTAAIAARSSGSSTYSGVCAAFAFPEDVDDLPAEFEEIRTDFGVAANDASRALTGAGFGEGAAIAIGGLPFVVVAIIIGSSVGASLFDSGLAVTIVGTRTTPRRFYLSILASALVAQLIAVLVALAALILELYGFATSANLDTNVSEIGVGFHEVLGSMPGLLWYTVVGVALGAWLRRTDRAIQVGVLILVLEWVAIAFFPSVPVLPTGHHAVLLPAVETRFWVQPSYSTSPATSAAVLVVAALFLGLLSLTRFVRTDFIERR